MKEEVRERFEREFFRFWFKQHYNLCHSDPRYLNATDYDIIVDYYEHQEWKERKQQSEDAAFKELADQGLACKECKTVFKKIPEDGSCPVCKTPITVPLDEETAQYLEEAGITPEEFLSGRPAQTDSAEG